MPEGLDGQRVDAALARLFGLSRTKAAELAAGGAARLDGVMVGKSDRVQAGALFEVALPDPRTPAGVEVVAEPVPGMAVVHDDADIVVVDKPVGVAAHPSVGWSGPTVVGGLAAAGYRISTSGAGERQGIVSRLDVGTSGLMVVCKSERGYGLLKRSFQRREVDKTYHALVQGLPDPLAGTVDAPIGRRPGAEFKFAIMSSGKPAITHYEVIEAFGVASLLEVKLETGRTHQIRVHLAAVRHPCVGDPMYGHLGFEHPGTGRYVEFSSGYPVDLRDALDTLRRG